MFRDVEGAFYINSNQLSRLMISLSLSESMPPLLRMHTVLPRSSDGVAGAAATNSAPEPLTISLSLKSKSYYSFFNGLFLHKDCLMNDLPQQWVHFVNNEWLSCAIINCWLRIHPCRSIRLEGGLQRWTSFRLNTKYSQ